MPAIELLAGFVTAPSSTLTALTMAAGNTLTIRNAPDGADIRLLQAWVDQQTSDAMRIRGPQFHDNVEGIRFTGVASEIDPLIPWGSFEKLTPQQVLTAELAGSATTGDIETLCLLIYYSEVLGLNPKFMSADELVGRMMHIMTVENTLALGTGGGYSGEEAINAEFDLWKANTDYALLGYIVSAECAAVRWRGSDTGNLGVGGPGNELDKQTTKEWFVRLSRAYSISAIPVFNSANKAGILIDGVQDENGTDVTVTSIFAELS